MQNFITIIKMELVLFRRSYLFYFMIVLFVLYFYILYDNYLSSDFLEAGQSFQASSYINMVANLFGLVFGFLMARRERQFYFQEVLSSLPGDNIRPFAKLIAWFLVSFFVTLMVYGIVLFIYLYIDSKFLYFSKEMFFYIITYWGLVLFSTGIIGYAIKSLVPKKWWSICILFLIWLFVSPFNSNLFGRFLPDIVLALFNLGERDVFASYNQYQGLNVSLSAIMKPIIFSMLSLFLLCLIMLIQKFGAINKKEKLIIVGPMVISFFIIIFSTHTALSPLDFTEFLDYDTYYYNRDYKYYTQLDREVQQEDLDVHFKVDRYDIQLSHRSNKIHYHVTLKINNPLRQQRLPFTLFHDMEVISLEMDKQNIEYTRKGDWLSVQWPDHLTSGDLQIEIMGNTGAFNPITENSFFLSSSFPWYPIPGFKVVAEKVEVNAYPHYRNLQLPVLTEFYVIVDDNVPVFSNLNEISPNEFYSSSYGATLMRGALLYEKIGNTAYIVPPDRIELVQTILPRIEEKIEKVANLIGEPKKQIPQNIYAAPNYSTYPSTSLFYADDYLTLNSFELKFPYSDNNYLTSIEGVFRAFYWNDRYNESSVLNAIVFEMILGYLDSPLYNKMLITLSEQENTSTDEIDKLVELAKQLRSLHYKDSRYLEILLKEVYSLIEDNPYFSIDDWFLIINQLKEKELPYAQDNH